MADGMTEADYMAIKTAVREINIALNGLPMEVVMCALADAVSMALAHMPETALEPMLALFADNVGELLPANREILAERMERRGL